MSQTPPTWCYLHADDRDRALARIGLHVRDGQIDEQALFAWFLHFAETDLASLTEGERLLLAEEYRAIQEVCLKFNQNLVDLEHLERTQALIRSTFDAIRTTGQTTVGPFELEYSILVPKFQPAPIRNRMALPLPVYHGEHLTVFEGKGMLWVFAQLLSRFGAMLEQCPKCAKWYPRTRQGKRFCSRKCQSQTAALEGKKRAKAKAKARARKTQRRTRASSAKGGKRHGSKK